MKIFNINNSYFKYQKCFSGITYQFVNQLDNIYDKNLMVGTNYCIYCMYNEFDIINNFMINLNQVDVCSTSNLDLTQKYYKIDNVNLKTGHKVILVNQDDKIENDVYQVDSRGYLKITDDLLDSGKTWRYKAYIKLGDNKGKQFHLINSGNRFPLKGEKKSFLEGHGYIIKNLFNYDLLTTGNISPKLVFTDYDLARISLNKNHELYTGFELPSFNEYDIFEIFYHEFASTRPYTITLNNDITMYQYTGNTEAYYDSYGHLTGGTIFNITGTTYGSETYLKTDDWVCSNSSIEDYIKLEISGSTNLYLKTLIKRVESPYLVLSDYISDYILNNYYLETTASTYTFTNLMYSEVSNINNIIMESFFSRFYDIDENNYLIPIEDPDNRYFDYDGIEFRLNFDPNLYFSTENIYVKYNLYNHLNKINPYIFSTGFTFLTDFVLSGFTAEYYDERPNPYVYPNTNTDIKGTLIKITPNVSSDTNYFKKFTYVNLTDYTGKYKTLIMDLVPNEYFIVETCRLNTGMTISTIETIYNLKEISDILYYVFVNEETQNFYYRKYNDDIRRNIFNGYAKFISEDPEIIDKTTAFLMLDDDHKFILKIYDPENLYNGGIIRLPTVYTRSEYTVYSTSAILEGEVIDDGGADIIERGILYSTTSYNFIYSAVTSSIMGGPYVCNVSLLSPLTIYYYKAYAINSLRGIAYGEIRSFTTLDPILTPPVVATNLNNYVTTPYTLTIEGDVVDIGYSPIIQRGFVLATGIIEPTTGDTVITYLPESGNVGTFSSTFTGLSYAFDYSFAAFASNVCGLTYGQSGITTTPYPSRPLIQTNNYNNLTYNSFDAYGTLTGNDDTENPVNLLGICYNTDPLNLPTLSDSAVTYTTSSPPYTTFPLNYYVTITGLTSNTTYYFRAYALTALYDSTDPTYGNVSYPAPKTNTLPGPPIVRINSVSTYSLTAAYSYNEVVSNSGDTVISQGLYYSIVNPPTTGDTYIASSALTSSWLSDLTGLTSGTTYYLMATAINNFGTGYSSVYTYVTGYPPTTANAGSDQTLCNVTSINLLGNSPASYETGLWTKDSGPGSPSIYDATSYSTIVNNLSTGVTVFKWTITSPPYPSSSDTVTITNYATPSIANAGSDINLCNATTTTMSASTPTAGTGTWSQDSGPSTVGFISVNSPTTLVTGITFGTYVFTWTVSNGICAPSTDQVTLINSSPPSTSNAGPDQIWCNATSITLSGNTPSGTEIGTWTLLSGPNTPTITDNHLYNTTVTDLVSGDYTFLWTISNGICAPTTDSVNIVNYHLPTTANAGSEIKLCNVTSTTSTTMSANIPVYGIGTWTQISGGTTANIISPNSNTTSITDLVSGNTYIFRWTISNGTCTSSSSDVNVKVFSPSDAGPDQIIGFGVTTSTLNGNSIPGTGQWTTYGSPPLGSVVNISNSNLYNATVSGMTIVGTYTFRWSNGNCPSSYDYMTITKTA